METLGKSPALVNLPLRSFADPRTGRDKSEARGCVKTSWQRLHSAHSKRRWVQDVRAAEPSFWRSRESGRIGGWPQRRAPAQAHDNQQSAAVSGQGPPLERVICAHASARCWSGDKRAENRGGRRELSFAGTEALRKERGHATSGGRTRRLYEGPLQARALVFGAREVRRREGS